VDVARQRVRRGMRSNVQAGVSEQQFRGVPAGAGQMNSHRRDQPEGVQHPPHALAAGVQPERQGRRAHPRRM
jgi:hypothetical protein